MLKTENSLLANVVNKLTGIYNIIDPTKVNSYNINYGIYSRATSYSPNPNINLDFSFYF